MFYHLLENNPSNLQKCCSSPGQLSSHFRHRGLPSSVRLDDWRWFVWKDTGKCKSLRRNFYQKDCHLQTVSKITPIVDPEGGMQGFATPVIGKFVIFMCKIDKLANNVVAHPFWGTPTGAPPFQCLDPPMHALSTFSSDDRPLCFGDTVNLNNRENYASQVLIFISYNNRYQKLYAF